MKTFFAPLAFLLSGLIFIITFNLIGAEVSPDGKLIEPFFLIPIGALLLFIGFIWSIIALINIIIKAKRNKK